MQVSPKKKREQFPDAFQKLWFPNEAKFRVFFNDYVRQYLTHANQYNDVSLLNKLIAVIPDPKAKYHIIRRLELNFRVKWDVKNGLLKYEKSRAVRSDIETFDVFTGYSYFSSENDLIYIDKQTLFPQEFVDFMLDTIILNRDAFDEGDLEKVEETLNSIRKRILRKSNQG